MTRSDDKLQFQLIRDRLHDHGSIGRHRTLVENCLADLLQRTGTARTLDDIKRTIYEDEMVGFHSYFSDTLAALNFRDISDADHAAVQVIQDAWNYFPHRSLNGRCPAEVFVMREATGSSSWMNELDPDHDRIDEAVLALLLLGLHDRARVWKGHDWDALARLFQKGYITDPARRAKSVVLTDLGLREARRFFTTLFTQAPEPVKPAPAFDPTRFNFVLLEDFRLPPNIVVYEYKNHAAVDSRKDFLRLNLYLALDGAYATIWFGLLEPMFAAAALASADRPREYDFAGYSEDLFRGYIDSDEAAEHIFKALRVPGSVRYALPQVLSIDADNNLKCDFIDVAVQ